MNKLYCGMDLHSRNTYIGIMNQKFERVFKKRVVNDSNVLLNTLLPYQEFLQGIVVESTYNSYWLVDLLMEAGYRVHLANPAGFKPYSGLKYADDRHSAFFLAKLLALGILPEGYIYPKHERPVRDLLRHRLFLVRHRTSHQLSFQSMIERNTNERIRTRDLHKLSMKDIKRLLHDDYLVTAALSYKALIDHFTQQIHDIQDQVKDVVQLRRPFVELKTIPGVGDILAMTMMLEVGDINRFQNVRNFSSYARCVPSMRISNEKSVGKGNKRNGNRYLSWAFSEAAMLAVIHNERIRKFYQKKSSKTNWIIAMRALSNKMARAAYYIMRDKIPFQEDRLL